MCFAALIAGLAGAFAAARRRPHAPTRVFVEPPVVAASALGR
jgi:hypothetical protein